MRESNLDREDDRLVLCADIGATSTKFGISNGREPVDVLASIPTRGPAEAFVESMVQAVDKMLHTIRSGSASILGLGVAVAGFLDESRGSMIYNSNLPWLEGYALHQHLASALKMRVELEVDSNAAALAEQRLGAGKGSARFLCLTAGTGLGVGMIVDGEPLRFAYGCMGDAGHIIVERDGPLCTCGGRGCAEILISAPVLAEQYRAERGGEQPISLREVIEAARNEDSIAAGILERAGEWLGIAAASLANIFFPDRIAIAGGLAEAGSIVIDPLMHSFQNAASDFVRNRTTLSRAVLGARATLTGAAYSVFDRLTNDV